MIKEMTQLMPRASQARRVRECAVFALLAAVTVGSAVFAKRSASFGPALVAVEQTSAALRQSPAPSEPALDFIAASLEAQASAQPSSQPSTIASSPAPGAAEIKVGTWYDAEGIEYYSPEPGHVRYYNGRPIRPARTVWMVTTAYSPDHRSCGKWADGKTASLKSVWTNAMNSVAADTTMLPFGSLVSVPGYASDDVVPVLDRGGAIKGARLDLLYPTHAIAREWGVQRLPVTIWEYADEEPQG